MAQYMHCLRRNGAHWVVHHDRGMQHGLADWHLSLHSKVALLCDPRCLPPKPAGAGAHWRLMLQAVRGAKASKAPRCSARPASSMQLVQLKFNPLLQSPGNARNAPCRCRILKWHSLIRSSLEGKFRRVCSHENHTLIECLPPASKCTQSYCWSVAFPSLSCKKSLLVLW